MQFLKKVSAPALNASPAATVTPKLAYKIERGGATAVYAFNVATRENGQFVLIAGDDKAPIVLGYGNGSFNYDSLPDNAKWWFNTYADQIEAIREGKASAYTPKAVEKAVPALLGSIQWGQDAPFNLYTPLLSSGEHCATGCPATQSAQIMRYHQWPEKGNGSVAYTTEGPNGEKWNLSADFNKTYNWSLMPPQYTAESTAKQKDAVARLMSDLGISFQSQYGEQTGATDASVAYSLVHYFGYDKGIRKHIKRMYTNDEWIALLKKEIDEGRPIPYNGWSTPTAGHAFVCDGYDEQGLFHINWGWKGLSDGYYQISLLNPEEQGTGGSAGGFNLNNIMLTGVQKPVEGSDYLPYILETAELKSLAVNGRTLSMAIQAINNGYDDYSGDIYIQIANAETADVVAEAKLFDNCTLKPSVYTKEYVRQYSFEFPASIKDGKYTLKFYSIDQQNRKLPVYDNFSDFIYVDDSGVRVGDVNLEVEDCKLTRKEKETFTVDKNVYCDLDFTIANTGAGKMADAWSVEFNNSSVFNRTEQFEPAERKKVSLSYVRLPDGPVVVHLRNNRTGSIYCEKQVAYMDTHQILIGRSMAASYDKASQELKFTATIKNLLPYESYTGKLVADIRKAEGGEVVSSIEATDAAIEPMEEKTVEFTKNIDLPQGSYTIGFTYENEDSTFSSINDLGDEMRASLHVGTTDVPDIANATVEAYQTGRQLVVNGSKAVAVYGTDGQMLYSGYDNTGTHRISSPSFTQGVLIVRTSSKALKVVWK